MFWGPEVIAGLLELDRARSWKTPLGVLAVCCLDRTSDGLYRGGKQGQLGVSFSRWRLDPVQATGTGIPSSAPVWHLTEEDPFSKRHDTDHLPVEMQLLPANRTSQSFWSTHSLLASVCLALCWTLGSQRCSGSL